MRRKGKKTSILLKPLLIILVTSTMLVAVATSVYYPEHLSVPFADTGESTQPTRRNNSNSVNLSEGQVGSVVNIVLLGFDRDAGREKQSGIFRPDTIMIASINTRTAEISLVSIPRDSYVQIHGTEMYDKINHAYMYGYISAVAGEDPHKAGVEKTLHTVRDFLGGVAVHNYIILDIDEAAVIVDSIGGVFYDVETEVWSSKGRRRILVEKGYQLLDGEMFMSYVRNRASAQGGEQGRIERQQKILIALFRQLTEEGRLRNLPVLYRVVSKHVETQLSFEQVFVLSLLGHKIKPEEIKKFVFEGRGQLSNRDGQNIWYLVIDEEKRVEIIRKAFGVAVEKRSQPNLPGPLRQKTAVMAETEPEDLENGFEDPENQYREQSDTEKENDDLNESDGKADNSD